MLRAMNMLAAGAVVALASASPAAAGGYGYGYGWADGWGYGPGCCGCVSVCAPPPPPPPAVVCCVAPVPVEPMYIVNQGPVYYGPGIVTLPPHVAPAPRVYPWVGFGDLYPGYWGRPTTVYRPYPGPRWGVATSYRRHVHRARAARKPMPPSDNGK
jgi:hypothetical protein